MRVRWGGCLAAALALLALVSITGAALTVLCAVVAALATMLSA